MNQIKKANSGYNNIMYTQDLKLQRYQKELENWEAFQKKEGIKIVLSPKSNSYPPSDLSHPPPNSDHETVIE